MRSDNPVLVSFILSLGWFGVTTTHGGPAFAQDVRSPDAPTVPSETAPTPTQPTPPKVAAPNQSPAEANGAAPAREPADGAPATAPRESTDGDVQAARSNTANASEERLRLLEERLEAQEQKIEALRQEIATANEQLESTSDESSDGRRLATWGFFDINFGKAYFGNHSGLYKIRLPTHSSFFMNGVNLYLKSDVSENLSTMVETRLTFTPVGYVSTNQIDVYAGNTYLQTSQEVFTGRWHGTRAALAAGISAERSSHRTRTRRLETEGLDSSATRTLPNPLRDLERKITEAPCSSASTPRTSSITKMVPIRQTGLQFYGLRELADSLSFDYAVTLSNGRGPIDEYKDLDGNKGLGARLKLAYSTDHVTLRLGGYGYTGRYTDSESRVILRLRPDLTVDTENPPVFGSKEIIHESYDERVLTLDALAQTWGAKVFAEYAIRKVTYRHAPLVADDDKLLSGVPYYVPLYAAAYLGKALYVVGAYEFELNFLKEGLKLTPYVGYDHIAPNNNVSTLNMDQYRGGLNLKPSPWLTAKGEVIRVIPESNLIASRSWVVVGQVAVAF
ncbi:MAG: hypothetical protein QM784_27015 [Polyangiaceae bacterium]